jgi:hypothetical protein
LYQATCFSWRQDGRNSEICPQELKNEENAGMTFEPVTIKPAANFTAHPYWTALLLSIATVPVFVILPEPLAQQWGALLLAMIGGAYIGFAARDGRPTATIIELVGALAFVLLALAGLHFGPLLIAAGYVAHGFWDLFHHRHGPYADTPHWYIPFCVVYDWIVGGFLIFWWW